MSDLTNKQLLNEIIKEQKIQAIKQLQLASDFSTYINKTELKFNEILNLLESNDKTKQKGVIEQVSLNTIDISKIKTDKKIIYSFGIAIAFLSNIIFKYFWK